MDNKDTNNKPNRKLDSEKYTQVLIRKETHKLLKSMHKKFNLSLLDILDNSLNFVNKMGFDPKDLELSTSPANEIKKLRTTVISFMRTQEKDVLFPMVNKLDAAVSILVEFLKDANPSLINRNVVNPITSNQSETAPSSGTSKFKIPSSVNVKDESVHSPIQKPIDDSLKTENFNLLVANEKKDKEIKILKGLISNFSNKITPKTIGTGYNIIITKEELDELKSI